MAMWSPRLPGAVTVYTGVMCAVVYNISTYFTAVEPYMDEIFHIPQAQQYCEGAFQHWDPKITTFPGLYLYSATAPLLQRFGLEYFPEYSGYWGTDRDLCSAQFLRLSVLLLAIAIPFVVSGCRHALFPGQSDGSMVGAMVFAFPLSFFYYFLYYTDTLSTLALLLCYWVSASNINRFSASGVNGTFIILQFVQLATAVIAILARQTNAVWLLHIAGTCMLRCVEENKSFSDVPLSSLSPTSLIAFVRSLFTSSPELLVVTWPLLLPVLLFIVFVFGFNEGGIVVGDKDNHRMVVHAAMPLHLGMAISLLLGPWEMIVGILELAKASITVLQSKSFPILEKMKLVLLVLVAFSAVTAVLFWGCLPHPFLEADNRHLSFYVWRYALSKPLVRLILGPIYAVCLWVITRRATQSRKSIWLLIYAIAACLTLLPAHLFEFRYFTPGAIIALLNMPTINYATCGWSIVTSYSIASVLLYVFLYKPFTWPDDSIARFML